MTFPFEYKGNISWLEARTILLVVHGSRSYGTFHEGSDYDYKGVTVRPAAYRDGFLLNFEQAEIKQPVDAVIYDMAKFFKLAADCNPNIIEVLWSDEAAQLIVTEAGRRLIDNRKAFISQKALHTFRGYAMSQLKRIRTHRRWLLEPPKAAPLRADFGLPERTVIPADQLAAAQATIRAKMDSWSIDFGDTDEALKISIMEQVEAYLTELQIGSDESFMAAGRLLGYSDNFLLLLDGERKYKTAQDNWRQYNEWKSERNVSRAALEAQFGYDTKHGMHLVRLMRMCREILTDGVVQVRRPDADELKAIRFNGLWSYDKLMEWAEQEDTDLVQLAKTSIVPHSPDRVFLDRLCQDITRSLPPE